jgi:hypothetical protein
MKFRRNSILNSCISQEILAEMFDGAILSDMCKKVGCPSLNSSDDIADYLISYVLRHYDTTVDGEVKPKISNFYGKHKKFTRFILISLSLFYSTDNIIESINKYRFSDLLKWEVEHIVPQSQKYNKFNSKNSKLKNQLGNLTILTKDTNVNISNKSFFKKCNKIEEFEKELRVNEVFCYQKVNFSKEDIRSREVSLNEYIYKIFIKDNGEMLRQKLKEYSDGLQKLGDYSFVQ